MAGAECTVLSALQKASGTSLLMVAGLKEDGAGAVADAAGAIEGAACKRTGMNERVKGSNAESLSAALFAHSLCWAQ